VENLRVARPSTGGGGSWSPSSANQLRQSASYRFCYGFILVILSVIALPNCRIEDRKSRRGKLASCGRNHPGFVRRHRRDPKNERGNMSDPIAPFLAQFPGPIRLRSPLWWRRAVLWCIIWQVCGLVVMTHTFPVGLIVVIVGAIGPWWYCAGALLLDDTGLIYKWPFWQSRRFLWIDVDHFELTSEKNEEDRVFGNVVFDYAHREGTWRGKWTTAMSGRNLGLLDTAINTGLTPDSLVRLMTEWRERALRP
jgi:hypothetical protein